MTMPNQSRSKVGSQVRRTRYLPALALLLATLSTTAIAQQSFTVTATRADMHEQASFESSVLATLSRGMGGTVLQRQTEWVRVLVAGEQGFVHGALLSISAAPSTLAPSPAPPSTALAPPAIDASSSSPGATALATTAAPTPLNQQPRHMGVWFPGTGVPDSFAGLMDVTTSEIVLNTTNTMRVGVGLVYRFYYADFGGSSFSSYLFGPNVQADMNINESVSVFAAGGAGPVMILSDASEDVVFDFDFAFSAGGAFWLSEGFGLTGKLLIGSGDVQPSIGISLR